MRERSLFIILILILLTLTLLRPAIGWRIARFFEDGAPDVSNSSTDLSALRAELAALRDAKDALPGFSNAGQEAFVEVVYPFNFKHELLVNLGAQNSLKNGEAAIVPAAENGVLIGRVSDVFAKEAAVQTIFDSNFQLGVRIGESGTEALLRGGSVPTLTLIPKSANIRIGDAIFTAGQGVPYGLGLGTVKEIRLVNGGLLQEATISLPYDINRLHALTILP